MKLRLSLMILSLILIVSSSFAQYPISKKIGNDSVVIMTTAQGRKINELFEKNEKIIDSIKTKYAVSTKIIDSLSVVRDTIKVHNDSLLSKYIGMRNMYEDMKWRRDTNIVIFKKAERKWNKETKVIQYANIGLITFIMYWVLTHR
jgi:hypothetical protein